MLHLTQAWDRCCLRYTACTCQGTLRRSKCFLLYEPQAEETVVNAAPPAAQPESPAPAPESQPSAPSPQPLAAPPQVRGSCSHDARNRADNAHLSRRLGVAVDKHICAVKQLHDLHVHAAAVLFCTRLVGRHMVMRCACATSAHFLLRRSPSPLRRRRSPSPRRRSPSVR